MLFSVISAGKNTCMLPSGIKKLAAITPTVPVCLRCRPINIIIGSQSLLLSLSSHLHDKHT